MRIGDLPLPIIHRISMYYKGNIDYILHKSVSYVSCIFPWRDTLEGGNFWNNIYLGRVERALEVFPISECTTECSIVDDVLYKKL